MKIAGVEKDVERTWSGPLLRLPDAEIRLADLRARCVMTTYDPDTAEQNVEVLRDIVRRFNGHLCLNAQMIRSGCIRTGDLVELRATGQT